MGEEQNAPDLLSLAPIEATFWGVERLETDGETGSWKRQTHRTGRQGGAVRFWPIEQLHWDMIRQAWGPGTYRLVWFTDSKRKRKGTSRPFEVPELAPEQPAPGEPSGDRPPPPPPQGDVPPAVAVAASKLEGQLLAQVLQNRPADDSPEGMALGYLERIAGMFIQMQGAATAQVKADAELRVQRAEAEAKRLIQEDAARYRAMVEQTRQHYDLIAQHTERLHSAEIELRDRQQADEVAELTAKVEELHEAMGALATAGGDIMAQVETPGSPWAELASKVGPDVIRGLVGMVTRAGGANGQAGPAVAADAIAEGAGAVLDAAANIGD